MEKNNIQNNRGIFPKVPDPNVHCTINLACLASSSCLWESRMVLTISQFYTLCMMQYSSPREKDIDHAIKQTWAHSVSIYLFSNSEDPPLSFSAICLHTRLRMNRCPNYVNTDSTGESIKKYIRILCTCLITSRKAKQASLQLS